MLYNGTPEVGEEPYTSVDQPLDLAAGVWEQPPVRAASPDRRLFDAMSAKIAALEQQVTQQQEYLVSLQSSVAMPARLSTNTIEETERHILNKHYGNRCDCTWCLSRGFDLRQGAWLERAPEQGISAQIREGQKTARAERRKARRKAWDAFWSPDARIGGYQVILVLWVLFYAVVLALSVTH
jgi:hypothetical protein